MVLLGAEIDEGQTRWKESGNGGIKKRRSENGLDQPSSLSHPLPQLVPARREGDGMSGDMEAAWDCVHKLFKLFDRKQTGPLRPLPSHPSPDACLLSRAPPVGPCSISGRRRSVAAPAAPLARNCR